MLESFSIGQYVNAEDNSMYTLYYVEDWNVHKNHPTEITPWSHPTGNLAVDLLVHVKWRSYVHILS